MGSKLKLMKKKLVLSCFLVVGMYLPTQLHAQSSDWTSIQESEIVPVGKRYIIPNNYVTFRLNVNQLRDKLNRALRIDNPAYIPVFIELPKSDGSFKTYQVHENETMSEGLAKQFPQIRSFDAIAIDNSGEIVKFDLTPQGFHAMFITPGKMTEFIDPYSFGGGDIENYIVYKRDEYNSNGYFECHLDSKLPTELIEGNSVQEKSFGNCTKRTYRLAVSATGEYTAFHGGFANAQAAQVTTINRVNGVYMKDLAVTLTLVANNNLIIFTNSSSDPFTNGDPGQMIDENQTVIDNVIGSSNYDIGHVFGTNSGGLAGLGVVCASGQKANGVTGSGSPVGDPFDIDYVAHEMGHQFSGNHSFRTNSGACNGNANSTTAMEPGSGSTIMAYAGICSPQDVQGNSNDYFHGVNLKEMHTFLNGFGNGCAVSSPISGQTAPSITSTSGNITIPISTPFALSATATDPDGDALTYCWEQMNNEFNGTTAKQPPVATNTGGPSFRSYPPTTSGTRYFPKMSALVNGAPSTWEVLPSVSRTMKFRLTVRDNKTTGGCNDHEDITVTTTASSGPFLVTYPNTTGIVWAGLSTQTVTWDVANTTASPVSCANVDVLISTDGGANFSVLANDVPNDGSQSITVPNTPSSACVIMVMSQNGTFFDISNKKFTITASQAGITETVFAQVSVYPNPSKGKFTLDLSEQKKVNALVLHDITGRVIQDFGQQTAKEIVFDLSNETKGIYFLQVTLDGVSKSFKLIRE